MKTVLEIIKELGLEYVYSDINCKMVRVKTLNKASTYYPIQITYDRKNDQPRTDYYTKDGCFNFDADGCLIWPSEAREDWQEFYDSVKQNEVVNVQSKEEWDFVSKRFGYEWVIANYKENICIELHKQFCGNVTYYITQGYKILSFDEWCKKEGIDNPFEDKVAVNVRDMLQWRFVNKHLGYSWTEASIKKFKTKTCIDINEQAVGDIDYCRRNGYTVLTFGEWCRQNDFDIPHGELKEVINVCSQEEWDFVSGYLGYEWEGDSYGYDPNGICIELHEKCHSTINYYKKHDYTVLSFEDWCKREGITPPDFRAKRVERFANKYLGVKVKHKNRELYKILSICSGVFTPEYWCENFVLSEDEAPLEF